MFSENRNHDEASAHPQWSIPRLQLCFLSLFTHYFRPYLLHSGAMLGLGPRVLNKTDTIPTLTEFRLSGIKKAKHFSNENQMTKQSTGSEVKQT